MKNKIISMSLHSDVLEEIDSLTKDLGLSGRSEAIRAGIKALSIEKKEREKLKGDISATLSVVHDHARDIGKLAHEFQETISSHLHNHLGNGKCLDIFILNGKASEIRKLLEMFQKNKRVIRATLTVC